VLRASCLLRFAHLSQMSRVQPRLCEPSLPFHAQLESIRGGFCHGKGQAGNRESSAAAEQRCGVRARKPPGLFSLAHGLLLRLTLSLNPIEGACKQHQFHRELGNVEEQLYGQFPRRQKGTPRATAGTHFSASGIYPAARPSRVHSSTVGTDG
jgi:hypothetical protein